MSHLELPQEVVIVFNGVYDYRTKLVRYQGVDCGKKTQNQLLRIATFFRAQMHPCVFHVAQNVGHFFQPAGKIRRIFIYLNFVILFIKSKIPIYYIENIEYYIIYLTPIISQKAGCARFESFRMKCFLPFLILILAMFEKSVILREITCS